MGSDPYSIPNFYGTSTFAYQAYGVGDGTWSNGDAPMPFMGGYTGHMGQDSYGMEGMFSTGGTGFNTTFGQPGFNYFHSNGDFSTWGNSPGGAMPRKAHYDEYYRASEIAAYGGGVDVKAVEHGMQGLGLSDVKVPDPKDHLKSQPQDLIQKESQPQQSAPKKMTWASIASQPAKPQPPVPTGGLKKKGPGMPPPPMIPGKHNMDIGTWEGKNGSGAPPKAPVAPPPAAVRPSWGGPGGPAGPGGPVRGGPQRPPPGPNYGHAHAPVPAHPAHPHPVAILHHPIPQQGPHGAHAPQHHMPPQQASMPNMPQHPHPSAPTPNHPVLDELRVKNNYNPPDYDLSAKGARFFVIKSYSEDDIHRSIKYEIWCSTEHGNKRLDEAYREREMEGGVVLLFFSVNGSGHFCGMAQMISPLDYNSSSSVWSQDKWKGQFGVRWIYVKDVPNVQLRHIRLENNENKPVTNSRDTQEVPFEKGKLVLRILHTYRHSTSIFDDFVHYEKRQEEEDSRKVMPPNSGGSPQGHGHGHGHGHEHGHHGHGHGQGRERDHGRDRDRDRGDRGDRDDRGDRGDRGDRPDRPDRPDRGDRGGRGDRGDRGDRGRDRDDRDRHGDRDRDGRGPPHHHKVRRSYWRVTC